MLVRGAGRHVRGSGLPRRARRARVAGLLAALDEDAAGRRPAAHAWRPLFAARDSDRIAKLQFALRGHERAHQPRPAARRRRASWRPRVSSPTATRRSTATTPASTSASRAWSTRSRPGCATSWSASPTTRSAASTTSSRSGASAAPARRHGRTPRRCGTCARTSGWRGAFIGVAGPLHRPGLPRPARPHALTRESWGMPPIAMLGRSATVRGVTDAITHIVEGAMASPWVLLALFAVAAIDGFFPVVPAESLVVTAGVFAASTGEPSLPLVVLAAALGAFTGDHVSYLARHGRARLAARVAEAPRVRLGGPDARRARRDDPRRLPLHPRRAHRGDAHRGRRALPAAHVLDLRRHRRAQLGPVLGAHRLRRRRRVRGGAAQGPRPRPRPRDRRRAHGRARPPPARPLSARGTGRRGAGRRCGTGAGRRRSGRPPGGRAAPRPGAAHGADADGAVGPRAQQAA